MDNLQQQYLLIGYTITEEKGIYYVQKQKATGDSERSAMPNMQHQGRDSGGGTLQSIT